MKILVLALIIGTLLIPLFASLTVRKMTGISQTVESDLRYFYRDEIFEDSFISPKSSLNSVVLKLKNRSLRNGEGVFFELLQDDQVIRKISLNGYNIKDGEWVRFSFAVIPNSMNRSFKIRLSSPNSTENNSLAVQVDKSGRIALITYHEVDSKVGLATQIYRDLLKRLTKDQLFLWLWFGLLTTSILVLRKVRV